MCPKEKINKPINAEERINFAVCFLSVSVILLGTVLLSSFKPKVTTNSADLKVEDTIYVYDTVVYYDTTVVYDTVYVKDKEYISLFKDSVLRLIKKTKFNDIVLQDSDFFLIKKPKSIKRKKYRYLSFDFLYAPLYSSQTFKSDMFYKDAARANKRATTPAIGHNFGVNINLHRQKNTFTGGLGITDFKTHFSTMASFWKIDTVEKMQLTQSLELQIDSIPLINIDTLLATGDTLYYYYKDTNYITHIDTAYISVPDSTEYFKIEKAKNSYSYIEIPLIFSHSFYMSNLTLNPEIGLISSFFFNSQGKVVSLADIYKISDLRTDLKGAYVCLSIYAGIKVNYYLNDKLDFISSVFYRRNINSIYYDYPLITHFNTFGLNFGLRYKLSF